MNAREAALKILYKSEEEGGYANLLVSDILSGIDSGVERAFASNIVYGVLKNKLALDYVTAQFSKIKPDKLSAWVRNILRCGIYQMLYMDKVPHSAACNESVKLARRYANSGAVGFVNGILRNVARNIDNIKFPNKSVDLLEYLTVKYSHPKWMIEKFLAQYGALMTEEILKSNNEVHDTFLRANLLKTTSEKLVDILSLEGLECEIDADVTCCIRLFDVGIDITRLKSYKDGLFSIQNKSSMEAAHILSPKKGEQVLDMCAAPGGKTTHIAEMMGNEGSVIACDVHEHKLRLIKDMQTRLGISIIETRARDMTRFYAEFDGKFDKVLLDAPCSGLGVIHKKPDIRWSRQEEDIAELVRIQGLMLDCAARYVKSGGVLVYSTCTILKEENSMQIERFLAQHNEFKKTEERNIFTHITGGTGFYICRLENHASFA